VARVTKAFDDYPGIGVCYDPNTKPFFEITLLEDLRLLSSKPLSTLLLTGIGAATPVNRRVSANLGAELRDIVFSRGVNVMCVPTSMQFIQSGSAFEGFYGASGFVATGLKTSSRAAHNPDGCTFYSSGGSYAEAADPAFSGDGQGTVSIMHYTNAQTFSQGSGEREATHSHIVLAHELIHSLHHLTGTRNEAGEEEEWTTGIGRFSDEAMSENKIRQEFGLPLRQAY
jgi:Effector protein